MLACDAFLSSCHLDVRNILNLCPTAPFFQQKFLCHRNSATGAPRHLNLAPPLYIFGKKMCAIKKLRHWAIYFKKISPITILRNVIIVQYLSHVSCNMSPFSCIMSLVSCLLSHDSYLTSPVSHLLSWVSCLTSLISRLLSYVSCLISPVLSLLSHVSCLIYPVSYLQSPVSRFQSYVSCLTSPLSCLISPVFCLLSSVSCFISPVLYLLSYVSSLLPHFLSRGRGTGPTWAGQV